MAQSTSNSDAAKQNQSSNNSSKEVVQEYVVRIPKVKNKRYSVMRFNSSLKVDVAKWACPKMERENNLKEFKVDEELPKYGAGSEFGRDQREESRRKKYGIISKKYNPDEQPWILKIGGKAGKKFKGIREGGVTENASYYVFTQAPDGAFEAFPIEEWYNFSPIHCYKALSAEEAEEEFIRRDKVMNYFNIMLKKRQKAEEQIDDDEEGEKGKGKGKGKGKKAMARKEFKITDADDWMNLSDDSDDESSNNENDGESTTSKKKKQPKQPVKKKKEKKQSSDEEPLEESDEGDFDNREVDYITNSSSSEEEPEDEKANRELKGVEDEEALRKLDASGDEEEEEGENKETEENQDTKEKTPEAKPKPKPKKTDNSSGDSSTDSSDSDFDDAKFHSAMFMQKQKKKNGSDSASSSRANTPTRSDQNKEGQRGGQKRKLNDAGTTGMKRNKIDTTSSASPSLSSANSSDGITEDAIRRYLSRKPMTASELLQKFKSKKTGMKSDQLVNKIASLLKKVNPIKHHIKNKMYFSLKS